MSEIVVIGGHNAQIYGTFADATAHMSTRYGGAYAAWLELEADDQKRALVAAADYLDRQAWIVDADSFEKRDAIAAFQKASYELGALIAEDDTIVTLLDQGNNISSVGAGGAFVNYANPTSAQRGTATVLPAILTQLIGKYLATTSTGGADGGEGQSSGARNPFSDCSDFDRRKPY